MTPKEKADADAQALANEQALLSRRSSLQKVIDAWFDFRERHSTIVNISRYAAVLTALTALAYWTFHK